MLGTEIKGKTDTQNERISEGGRPLLYPDCASGYVIVCIC